MKILKFIGIGIVAIIAIFLITGLFAPKKTKVERSITINASKDVIMPQIRSLRNMQTWSPWAELDPNMKVTYEGNDGQVGSKSSWVGNDDVGSGNQTISSISENRVGMDLHFIEPFESTAQGYIELGDENGTAKVTWGFDFESPYPWNAMGVFMNMDEMVGKDFEKGLNKLKGICETMPAATAATAVEVSAAAPADSTTASAH